MSHTFKPNYAIPPGETLQEIMEERRLEVSDLSKISEIPEDTLKGILSATIIIEDKTANQLEIALGVPKHFWLNLESNYCETLNRLEISGVPLMTEENGIVYESE